MRSGVTLSIKSETFSRPNPCHPCIFLGRWFAPGASGMALTPYSLSSLCCKAQPGPSITHSNRPKLAPRIEIPGIAGHVSIHSSWCSSSSWQRPSISGFSIGRKCSVSKCADAGCWPPLAQGHWWHIAGIPLPAALAKAFLCQREADMTITKRGTPGNATEQLCKPLLAWQSLFNSQTRADLYLE